MISKTFENANYLQGLEGGLDTSHSSFAHIRTARRPGAGIVINWTSAPRLDVEPTDYGYIVHLGTRDVGEDGLYAARLSLRHAGAAVRGGASRRLPAAVPRCRKLDGHIWVPDRRRNHLRLSTGRARTRATIRSRPSLADDWETQNGRGPEDLVPGTFRLKKSLANDYMIDRERQKTKTFTGIVGINTQDFALQEGMGHIADRSQEHLGTSDKAIIATRQLLLEATGPGREGRKAARHRALDVPQRAAVR